MAAQKAFFEAALAGKPAPVTEVAASRAAAAARAVASAEATANAVRLPKPGSIIDIWV
jgi:hypothetical protein